MSHSYPATEIFIYPLSVVYFMLLFTFYRLVGGSFIGEAFLAINVTA